MIRLRAIPFFNSSYERVLLTATAPDILVSEITNSFGMLLSEIEVIRDDPTRENFKVKITYLESCRVELLYEAVRKRVRKVLSFARACACRKP